MADIITEYPQFFTATNLEWKKLLKPDKYKDILIDSLKFLVESKRVRVFCFIIMDNHIHIIWQMLADNKPANVQRDFLKLLHRYSERFVKKSSGCFAAI